MAVADECRANNRTGKSFFLNQLTRESKRRAGVTHGGGGEFRVGPTTESCTRGIWLWAPEPPIRNAVGERVLFMDTEGLAATDNDERYDAQIFSLGLLLSSLFVFNTMGVIDEGAIDRLYLVSELTKHVCVSADTGHGAVPGYNQTSSKKKKNTKKALSMSMGDDDDDIGGDGDEDGDEDDGEDDTLEASRALAPHFPPFVWLLRDFLLDMQSDGTALSADEYLEKALEPRVLSGGGNQRRRQQDRNRIRESIRILFARRACLTLVRPVTDESTLRHASRLTDDELRAEFVQQMTAIRARLLHSDEGVAVRAKRLFGKVLDGPQVAHLARCYTETMTSGAVPDIKAAWEYVADATCQQALAAAVNVFDTLMAEALTRRVSDGDAGERDEPVILSQQEYEHHYKRAQEEALALFRDRSVEGASRAASFQALKQHVQRARAAQIAELQRLSAAQCAKVLAALHTDVLIGPLRRDGDWEKRVFESSPSAISFSAAMDALEKEYDARAQGPAHKTTLFQFLRDDVVRFVDDLADSLAEGHARRLSSWETERAQLERQCEDRQNESARVLELKDAALRQLEDAKTHLEDKLEMQHERIQQISDELDTQRKAYTALDHEKREEAARAGAAEKSTREVISERDKLQLQLEHSQQDLQRRSEEHERAVQKLESELSTMRLAHESDREAWIQRTAELTSDKTALQRQLKQEKHDAQQLRLDLELRVAEQEALALRFEEERAARQQAEDENAVLSDLAAQREQERHEHVSAAQTELSRARSRLKRLELQLGAIEDEHEVERTLRSCVDEVARLADAEKIAMQQEERTLLQDQLGELYLKISTLPEFYQRQVFCSPEPTPDFFDVLTG